MPLISLVYMSAFSLSAVAGGENDTIIYRDNDNDKQYNITIRTVKKFKYNKYYSAFVLDFGYNRFDDRNMFTGERHQSAANFPKLRNSKSTSFAMYAMFGRKIFKTLSIASGLGVKWENYRFSKAVTIKEIDDIAMSMPIESVLHNFSYMKKSKLADSYLEVPLLLKLHLNRFSVSAGVTGGLNIGSHTKVVFIDKNSRKQTYNDYNIHLPTFRYGYTARAGFRYVSIFANYYPCPLFAKDMGPQVYPFTIGVSLSL